MNQRGSTIVESMVCMLLLCLVLFSLLQVFNWSLAKIICQFSSSYAAKGRALGYAYYPIETASRARAIPASGRDTLNAEPSPSDDHYRYTMEAKIRGFMGDSSVLNYEYWDNSSELPPAYDIKDDKGNALYKAPDRIKLHVNHWTGIYNNQPVAVGNVWIENMPLLDPWQTIYEKKKRNSLPAWNSFSNIIDLGLSPFNMNKNSDGQSSDGQSMMYNYSKSYLEDDSYEMPVLQ